MIKRILFVYDRMMTGGTTSALLAFLQEIDRTEYQVDLLLFDHSGEFMDAIPEHIRLLPEAKKPSRFPVAKRKILRTLFNGSALRSLLAYWKYRGTPKGNLRNILMHFGMKAQVGISRKMEETYDVAIGFIEGWASWYVLSNKVRAEKKIAWIHPDYEKSYLIPEADRKYFSRADAIVTVANNCRINMQNAFPELKEKVWCIENIVSPELTRLRAQEQIPEKDWEACNLCTVARCDIAVKGLDRMLSAMEKLRDEGLLAGVKWHLIGGGGDFESFSRTVEEKGLGEHIVLYGMRKNPMPYVKNCDLFVLASRYEGKPVSVEEALCLGVPCLVTEYASAYEQIRQEENGLVVANSEEGLYQGLKQILTDRTLLDKLKQGAQCGPKAGADQMEKLYELLRS